ncbi:15-O-acetyltransferase Tri3 [Aureobasidium pullulans]|uniref:15-O-acetyltransferase Tri3 n=1 Tax=Aureobasidium pullulans TaxID=5580 RepID=A0A4S9LUT4_AURPU|nr:15-O-acetyltransferase Tri3 [Aureobasidium pullulans]
MAIIQSKNVDPVKYRWQALSDGSASVQRRGNGTENWVGLRRENAQGQYDLHILVKTELHKPTSLASLKERLVNGLLKQRFEHPNIACKAVWDDQFGPLIRYTPPANDTEATEWAQESIELFATPQSGHDLRREIVAQRKSQNKSSKSFTVYMLGNVTHYDQPLEAGTELEILTNFNHIHWDGISARQFVGDLICNLGQEHENAEYGWGQEIDRLSPPLLDALKVNTQTLGTDYGDSLEEFLTSMFAFGSSHAVQIGTAPGLPATAVLQIAPHECQKIIQGVKSRLGSDYTITHLGQAATLLALLKSSPIPPENVPGKSVIMPLPVNGRRFLREEFANYQYGSCQACAVVVFNSLEQFMIDFDDRVAVLDALISGMKITRSSYDYWLNKPFLLPLGLAKDNFVSAMLESVESKPDGKAVPIFASDGMNDLYIPKTVSTSDGSTLLSVKDIVFLTDSYQPGILLRMESWNGTTTLSLSYCDGSYSSQEANIFLQCMKDFMMALA